VVVWFLDTDFVYVFFTDREVSEDLTEVTASPRRTPPGQEAGWSIRKGYQIIAGCGLLLTLLRV
jgi:hypothetical protein